MSVRVCEGDMYVCEHVRDMYTEIPHHQQYHMACSPEEQATQGIVLPACSRVLRTVGTEAYIMR